MKGSGPCSMSIVSAFAAVAIAVSDRTMLVVQENRSLKLIGHFSDDSIRGFLGLGSLLEKCAQLFDLPIVQGCRESLEVASFRRKLSNDRYFQRFTPDQL